MMRLARLGAFALAFVLAACSDGGGGTGSPSRGSLEVSVTGLPAGTSANVTVTGPGNFTRTVSASTTIADLAPGTYTVTAAQVGASATGFAVPVGSQTVSVAAGGKATATVAYQSLASSLSLAISGVKAGLTPTLTVTGPAGFTQTLSASGTLFGLAPGVYTVVAGGVASADSTFQGRPYRQTVVVSGDGAASAPVAYQSVGPAALDLVVDGINITQAAQDYAGTIPLVKDRPAYLRVFVRGTVANTAFASVRVRYFINGTLTRTDTLTASGTAGLPLVVQESTSQGVWSLALPSSIVQPGLSIQADVDPEGALKEADETNNLLPAAGPRAVTVYTVPALQVRFIPIHQQGTALTGRITAINMPDYIGKTRKIYPFSTVESDLHAVYNTNIGVLSSDGDGWEELLAEMDALRDAEGSQRDYVGVIQPTYNGGIAGLGYIGWPAALVWDLSDVGNVTAHELGHNFNRRHTPCGSPGGVDQTYPYPAGNIGIFGVDVDDGSLHRPTETDIMGYCSTQWISDYTYRNVLEFMKNGPPQSSLVASGATARPSLLVWGRVGPQGLVLEPAFALTTRPSMPAQSGPYMVEALDATGARVFAMSFAGTEVGDGRSGQRHFSFTVPVDEATRARIATLRLSGGGQAAAVRTSLGRVAADRGVTAVAEGSELARDARGRVLLKWDAAQSPMAMVRDARTGQVIAFARGGSAALETGATQLDVTFSDGVRGTARRMTVPAR
ncbi:MAG TPA: hypothetical protein VFH27_17265 [Longimicrobiaceae bacterium]|nr:hypothetical protein [Longimicrobiaceae bacterium]